MVIPGCQASRVPDRALEFIGDNVWLDEGIVEREVEIFGALRRRVAGDAPRIQDTARGLASFDVLGADSSTPGIAISARWEPRALT